MEVANTILANTILALIHHKAVPIWGLSCFLIKPDGLSMRLKGTKFVGLVGIQYKPASDLYAVRVDGVSNDSRQSEIVEERKDILAEDLASVIDSIIG